MTIKEKLKEMGINVDKDKQVVEDIKKALVDAGEIATKISNKLTPDGIKVIENFISKNKVSTIKKQVTRPKSLKLNDEDKKGETDIVENSSGKMESKIGKLEVKENDVKGSEQNSNVKLPIWKGDLLEKNSNLKISIRGKTNSNNSSNNNAPNGRPLPQSTLDELKRKKEEKTNKLKIEQNKNSEEDSQEVGFAKKEEMNNNDVKNVVGKLSNVQEQSQVENVDLKNKNVQNIQQQNMQQTKQQLVQKQTQNLQKYQQGSVQKHQQGQAQNQQRYQQKNQQQNNKQQQGRNKNQNTNSQNRKQNQNGNQEKYQLFNKNKNDKFTGNKNQNYNSGKTNSKLKNNAKLSNFDFVGKNVTFNPNNTNIVAGTNNYFEGKKHEKNKTYNKDFENKKQPQKNVKNKNEKYKTNINNYDNDKETVRKKKKTGAGAFVKPEPKTEKPMDEIKSITIPEVISIKALAEKLKMQPAVIVKKIFLTAGKMVTPNTELSYEEAENIAVEYDILCEKEKKEDVIAELLKESEELEENLVTRPPVVCVMGHVDHGKTSILDAIRKTNVIAKEAGGITQHIGAYQVKIKDRIITFLDTPGHEAFTAMRLRGAKSTDIAVLVVAADDGVKPQTIEAINHAKAANVEIIVAINKVDKPEANVERVKQQLSEYELIPSDWGGQTSYCEVSAKQNIGIENLLEMILLTADVMDLRANPNRNARGIVIESLLDKGKGPVARILVQKGTLHVGDYVAMGKSFGKVRAMSDYNGTRVREAKPSTPVEILGLNDIPQAGDIFMCFDDEKSARSFAETFVTENKKKLVEDSKHKVTLDALFDQIKAGELKELNVVLKADVAGSSEAIKNSLEKLSNDEVVVKVIHEGVGNINESDITLASASNAIIIGFNVKPEPNTKSIIERENVDLRLYNIIYNAIDDVEKAMKGMLAPVYEEKVIGSVIVRQIFKASSVGNIAGSYVNDGEVRRDAKVRVKRDDNVIFDGSISSLKHFKDEVKEVKTGFECGIVVNGFSDFVVDDIMEVYVVEEKKITYAE